MVEPVVGNDELDDDSNGNALIHHRLNSEKMEFQYDLTENDFGSRPMFFKYLPKLFRYDHAPIEATGCTIDMWARATIFMASIFLGPALLGLASNEAQSSCDAEEAECDDARVYGFKPSSLLTNIAIVAGLIATILLPLFGAITDHTPHRRSVGGWSAAGLIIIKIVELALSQKTWFVVAWLQVASSILYQLHVSTLYAYSAELTNEPTQQSQFQTHFFLVMYVSMVLYMLEVLIPGTVMGLEDVGTARWAVLVTVLTSMIFFSVAWKFLFRERPALSTIPQGQTLWTVGFTKLYQSYGSMEPCVGIFLKGIMFSEAADSALATIATTYMSEYLQMDSLQIGMVILLDLMGGIPGTWLGHFVCSRSSPVVSAQVCLTMYIIVTAAASMILSGPEHQKWTYLFGILWGMCQGWMHPQHTTIFITITPNDSTMEWMGVFLFACQILCFVPPLVFTVLNEVGWSMQWGLASLILFFAVGMWGLIGMGDYSRAITAANGNINE